MAEEIKAGEQAATTPQVETPVQPESKPEATTSQQPNYEELLGQMRAEQETMKQYIGKQAEEIGSLRNDLAYRQLEAQRRGEGQTPGYTDEDFLAKPVDTVRNVVKKELEAMQGQWQQREAQNRMFEAKASTDQGFQEAMRRDPELFKGVEGQVYNLMAGYVQQGYVHPANARNPENWKLAAQVIHLQSGHPERIIASKPTAPVKPTETLNPNATARPNEPDIDISEVDAAGRELAASFGINDEGIKEAIKKGRGRK